jgi:hypothetical protein
MIGFILVKKEGKLINEEWLFNKEVLNISTDVKYIKKSLGK